MSIAVKHSIAVAGEITAAGNPRKCQHAIYRMNCTEYDALEARGDGCCEICGLSGTRLFLDHDHALGESAVRGLLCPKCNSHLRFIDKGKRAMDTKTAAYLANPWRAASVVVDMYETTHPTGGDPLSVLTGLTEATIRDLAVNGWHYVTEDGQPSVFRSPAVRMLAA